MVSIISVIVLLGVLIFIHELGHFLTAKFVGVGVLKFSLGFGPRLIGKKVGETDYLLSLIPLGGYVKLLGESEEDISADAEVDLKRSFLRQSVGKKMLIVAAGPLFNLLLAMLIFTFINIWGVPVLLPKIGSIQEGSAALKAGLQAADYIVAIDGRTISRWTDMADLISNSEGRPLKLTIRRGDEVLDIAVQPTLFTVKNIFGEDEKAYKIGITPAPETKTERLNPLRASAEALRHTWMVSKLTLLSVIKIFEGVISPKTLGGPIMIAQLAGAQAKEGLIPFFLFMALLSINLAVLNLLPIPILDGGHLFFYLIEAVTGKEINIKWRERAQQVGFVLLILLMLFVIIMDLERLNIPFLQDIIKTIPKTR